MDTDQHRWSALVSPTLPFVQMFSVVPYVLSEEPLSGNTTSKSQHTLVSPPIGPGRFRALLQHEVEVEISRTVSPELVPGCLMLTDDPHKP